MEPPASTSPLDVDVPYRAWMRAMGRARPGRSRSPALPDRYCVACGVREAAGWGMSLDHIVPQTRLRDHPDVKDSPLNHQWLCSTTTRTTRSGRRLVVRFGCNHLKADGPAVDHRAKASLYRGLVRLLIRNDVEVDVAWRPLPFLGREVPRPSIYG